jgi:hypothetical protein
MTSAGGGTIRLAEATDAARIAELVRLAFANQSRCAYGSWQRSAFERAPLCHGRGR